MFVQQRNKRWVYNSWHIEILFAVSFLRQKWQCHLVDITELWVFLNWEEILVIHTSFLFTHFEFHTNLLLSNYLPDGTGHYYLIKFFTVPYVSCQLLDVYYEVEHYFLLLSISSWILIYIVSLKTWEIFSFNKRKKKNLFCLNNFYKVCFSDLSCYFNY